MKFYATFGGLVLFGAYSVVRKLINRATKKHLHSNTLQQPLIIRDIQLEILNIILRDIKSNNEDLNNYSLVCKEWNSIIRTDQIWMKKLRLLHYKGTAITKLEEIQNQSTSEVISSIFGCVTNILPPRTIYYLSKPKLDVFVSNDCKAVKFTPDLIQVPQEKVWKPWLNHDIIHRPDILLKFIYTIIKYPRWIFPMISSYSIGGHMPFTKPDSCNSKRFEKLLFLVSCFSFLPWLDIVISNTPSFNLLWDRPMWPIFTQIQALLCLTLMQLFDNSFTNKRKFFWIRGALAIITMILTKGLKSSLYTSVLILGKFIPEEEVDKHWILAVLVVIAVLMISYPIATVLILIMQLVLFIDSVIRGMKNSPRKMSYARYFLLLNIMTIVWAIIN